jgi:hypothetical protein
LHFLGLFSSGFSVLKGEKKMQSGNILTFEHLSQFNNIKDFNNHVEQWMVEVKVKFTKSELVALKRLIRFSAKITGVCNAKIGTIVSATHQKDGAGISRSTFKRMITKAKNLGFIAIHSTVRKNGSKSSNVYVFNRFCTQSEPSKIEKLNQPETSNLSKTNNKNNNKRSNDVSIEQKAKKERLDASFTSNRVPAEFINLVRSFYDDASKIEEYWKLVKISAYKNNVSDDFVDIGIESFKALVRKLKLSKVQNTYGYFYGVLHKKFRKKYLVDLFNSCYKAI